MRVIRVVAPIGLANYQNLIATHISYGLPRMVVARSSQPGPKSVAVRVETVAGSSLRVFVGAKPMKQRWVRACAVARERALADTARQRQEAAEALVWETAARIRRRPITEGSRA
jgi:hypothetical protein